MPKYLTVSAGESPRSATPVMSVSDPATVDAVMELLARLLTGEKPIARDHHRVLTLVRGTEECQPAG